MSSLHGLGCALVLSLVAVPTARPAQEDPEPGGVVTLRVHDDLQCSFSFRRGEHGGRVIDGQIDLSDAQLVYGAFEEELLSFGFVHDELVSVVDLGHALVPPQPSIKDEAAKFPISVFHTLFLDSGRIAYQDGTNRTKRLRAGDDILRPPTSGGLEHLLPVLGHTYLLRYRQRTGSREDRLVKFQVIDLRPGLGLTFRWAPVAEL